MPAVSSLQPDDKATVKRSISGKILTATVARVFYQRGDSWKYSGIQGGLCLVVDKQKGGVWFRVVDLLVRSPRPAWLLLLLDARGAAAGSSEHRPPAISHSSDPAG